jgi:hypothetical protein
MIDKGQAIISGALHDKHNPYLDLRRRYEPKPPKLIIVAESPPEPKPDFKYFYEPTGLTNEPLFSALMKRIHFNKPLTKAEGLSEFQRRGWFLVDATYQPVNKTRKIADEIILRDYPLLMADLNELTPDRRVPVILIKANVCELLKPKLVNDGFNVINHDVDPPFPSHGWQPKFHEKFDAILNTAGLAPHGLRTGDPIGRSGRLTAA